MSWHFLRAEQITAEEIARAESPITHLAALQLADSPLDLLLCAGHFKALSVYRHGKVCMCVHVFCLLGNHFVLVTLDLLLCAGHFKALSVYRHGKVCMCVHVFCLLGNHFVLVTLKLLLS